MPARVRAGRQRAKASFFHVCLCCKWAASTKCGPDLAWVSQLEMIQSGKCLAGVPGFLRFLTTKIRNHWVLCLRELGVIPQKLLTLLFGIGPLTGNCDFLLSRDKLASKSQGSSCIQFPSAQVTGMPHHACFLWVLEMELRASCL